MNLVVRIVAGVYGIVMVPVLVSEIREMSDGEKLWKHVLKIVLYLASAVLGIAIAAKMVSDDAFWTLLGLSMLWQGIDSLEEGRKVLGIAQTVLAVVIVGSLAIVPVLTKLF